MAAGRSLLWLLDTNIVSELARPQASPHVVQRFAAHAHEAAIPAIVWHELLYGVLRLPSGRRQDELTRFVHAVAGSLPKLPYDEQVARQHAELRAAQASQGRALAEPDAQIAAQALAQGLTLVTRNTRDFQRITGLRLANWFDA